jgi:ribosomal protein S12 methylthiotransferase accessory factor
VALVDTRYTIPSIHTPIFRRVTTGLGAGRSMAEAVTHAILEILERHAVATAGKLHGFFDNCQIDLSAVRGEVAGVILNRLSEAKLLAGAWQVPTTFDLPVYWCHVMESEDVGELVPFPPKVLPVTFARTRPWLEPFSKLAKPGSQRSPVRART